MFDVVKPFYFVLLCFVCREGRFIRFFEERKGKAVTRLSSGEIINAHRALWFQRHQG